MSGETVLLLADATRRRRRLRMTYRAFSGGRDPSRAQPTRPRRPFGTVVPGVLRPSPRRSAHVPRGPDAPRAGHERDGGRSSRRVRRRDVREHVARPRSLGVGGRGRPRAPGRGGSAARASTLAELIDQDGATVLRMRADSLDWAATMLAGLGCSFSIRGRMNCARVYAIWRSVGRAPPSRPQGAVRRGEDRSPRPFLADVCSGYPLR